MQSNNLKSELNKLAIKLDQACLAAETVDQKASQSEWCEDYRVVVEALTHLEKLEYENRRLSMLLQAASHLLLAAKGPKDGPTSWIETRDRLLEKLKE